MYYMGIFRGSFGQKKISADLHGASGVSMAMFKTTVD